MRSRLLAPVLSVGLLLGVAPVAASAAPAPAAVSSLSYPYAHSNPDGIDPWGAYFRQCTSFASWWLTAHGIHISKLTVLTGPKGEAALHDAKHWDAAAKQAGYAVSRKPIVGAIAQWHANERTTWKIPGGYTYFQAESAGHVAVVMKVYADGSVLLQDYNSITKLGSHTFRARAPRYLLIHT